MKFWRRLKIYLIGFGLGLIIVYIIFGKRDLDAWMPQQRVLSLIDSVEISLSKKASCQLNCLGMEPAMLDELREVADVDFSESHVRKKPCPIYHLNSKYEGKNYLMIWEVCEKDGRASLHSLQEEGRKCTCPS